MSTPKIESYHFGEIVIDGQTYTNDVIILPDRVVSGWWREKGHELHPEDLDAVMEAGPGLLIVGRGAQGRMRVTRATHDALEQAGIDLVVKMTEQACEEYNALRDVQDVAAALHLTC
jgi:hypothetical protein